MLEKDYSEWKEFFDSGLAEEARKVPMNSLVGTVINMKWSYLFGLFCGLTKVHLVSVHAAFRVSDLPQYAMSGVRLSRAV